MTRNTSNATRNIGSTFRPTPSTTSTTPKPFECPADIVLVVDSSGSIKERGRDNWDIVKQFVGQLVENLPIAMDQNHVAALTFSSGVNIEFPFLSNKNEILTGIDNFYYEGSTTNIADALSVTRNQMLSPVTGDRASQPNVVILLTDGNSTVNRERVELEASLLREKARILVVGVTNDVDDDEVAKIVSDPFYYHPVNRFSDLFSVLQQVINGTRTCDPPVINPIVRPLDALALTVELRGNANIGYVNYNNVTTNINNKWDGERFLAPGNGTYMLHWTAATSLGLRLRHSLTVNGQTVVSLIADSTVTDGSYMTSRTISLRLNLNDEVRVYSHIAAQNMPGFIQSTSFTAWKAADYCPGTWLTLPAPLMIVGDPLRIRFSQVQTGSSSMSLYDQSSGEIVCPASGYLLLAYSVGLRAGKSAVVALRGAMDSQGNDLNPYMSSLSIQANGRTILSRQTLVRCNRNQRMSLELRNGEIYSDGTDRETSLAMTFCPENSVAFSAYTTRAFGPVLSNDVSPFEFDKVDVNSHSAFIANRYIIPETGVYYFYLSTAAQQFQMVHAQIIATRGNSNMIAAELRRVSVTHNGIEGIGRGVILELEQGQMVWVKVLRNSVMYSDVNLHTTFFGLKISE